MRKILFTKNILGNDRELFVFVSRRFVVLVATMPGTQVHNISLIVKWTHDANTKLYVRSQFIHATPLDMIIEKAEQFIAGGVDGLVFQGQTTDEKVNELMLANEKAITGLNETEVNLRLDRIIAVMKESVRRGVHTEGFLPGPIGLHRKAALLYQRAKELPQNAERLLVYLCAYAFAAAEENAAGHIVVTAPTCGSAGVVPSIVSLLLNHYKLPIETVRGALLASVAIGFIAKQNASISGAEVGCQGEIGVASSMAAALLAFANDNGVRVAENAAETALEHHLGMTCDPVKGYVQIPCIERNAMGAVKAYTAWLIAREGLPVWHIVGLDNAVEAMNLTGRDMKVEYRETSQGGLARCC